MKNTYATLKHCFQLFKVSDNVLKTPNFGLPFENIDLSLRPRRGAGPKLPLKLFCFSRLSDRPILFSHARAATDRLLDGTLIRPYSCAIISHVKPLATRCP